MSQHETATRLRHMLDHTREAMIMIQDKSRADLETDRKLNLALVRLLEIVGEAASRIPTDERSKYPEIPWAEIVSLRNRLIHGYDTVDFDIMWQILTHDLPRLVADLEKLVSPEAPD